MPDGTTTDGGAPSNLFAKFNAGFPTATWQREFARALQTWADVTPLNFHFVADTGASAGAAGSAQGDSRFGDIRLGGYPASGWAGQAYSPGSDTMSGDLYLNTAGTWHIGTSVDLYSVVLHETGHAIGMEHSGVSTAVMYPSISGVDAGLTSDDIAGIQSLYGARQADVYDVIASNNSLGSSTALSLTPSGAINVGADLTTLADVDYYRVIAPSGTNGTLSVSVDARNLSLLAPKVMVYNASGTLLSQTALGTFDYGKVATVNLTGLVAGQTYYVVADGGTSDVFGMGAYVLDVQFGMGTVSAPTAPSSLSATSASASQINLAWADNASNEDGFRIERSTDGTNFTQIATAGANATSYAATGLSASTTYYFRVRAYNGGGDSGYSNIAQATTQIATPSIPLAPSSLSATAASTSQINLAWLDNASNESGFNIERSTDGINFTQVATAGANTTSYAATGLSAGTTYYFRVRAYNGGGNSSYSNTATGITLVAIPVAPTSLTPTTASTSQINLVWLDNASNESGFNIERSTDGINFTQVATAGANTTSYAATGLTASTTYYFRVRAYNGGGNSGYSNTATGTTLVAIPVAPSSLTATTASTSQINLAWADNANNESGFSIERSTDGINFTQVATAGANTTSYAATGLSAGTTYYFRVRAYNAGGNSIYCNIAQATTPIAAPSIPLAPSSLSATASSTSQINLAWVDNASNEDGFNIERSTDGINFTQVATAGANTTSYAATGLTAGTTYYFRVRAYNAGGGNSGYSNTATGTTLVAAPVAPSSLTATATSTSQINLTWLDNANNESGFNIERSTDGINFTQIATAGANATSYAATGLTASTTYHFRVRAYNGGGNSGFSNTATATTQAAVSIPAPPTNLTGILVSGKAQLNWVDQSNNETGFIIERATLAKNGTMTWSTLTTVGSNVTSYLDTSVAGGKTYYYRIKATNSAGTSVASNQVSVVIPKNGR